MATSPDTINVATATEILELIDKNFDALISAANLTLASVFRSIITILLISYIAAWGLGVWGGRTPSFQDLLTRLTKLVIIGVFGSALYEYKNLIIPFFRDGPDALLDIFANKYFLDTGYAKGKIADSINTAIELSYSAGQKIKIMSSSDWIGAANLNIALVIWLTSGLICSLALALMIFPRVAITALLFIGPLVGLTLLTEKTQSILILWGRSLIVLCLNYFCIMILLKFFFDAWAKALQIAEANAVNGWAAYVPAFIMGVAIMVVLYSVQKIISKLAGQAFQ